MSNKKTDTFVKNFCKHKLAVVAFIVIVLEVLTVIFLPMILRVDPNQIDAYQVGQAPSAEHILGTDQVGRDLLARILYGGRVSLWVGFASVVISIVIGLPLGLLAGYYRGPLETIVMRAADVFMSVPPMILILVIVSIMDPSISVVTIVIGVLGWPSIARLLYANVLSVRNKEYVESAKAIGTKDRELLFRYVLPNSIAPIWMNIAFRISSAIMTESALSFLGAGVQPPDASWGNIMYVAQSLGVLKKMPWVWIAPGLCLVFTIVCINLVGEGVRDALDPKMKRL
nr:ABC transporter permease [Lachnospiraceae bacterium]